MRTVFRKVRPFNQFGLVGTRDVKVQSIGILNINQVFTLLYLRCLGYVVYKVTDSELIQGCNLERPFICFGDNILEIREADMGAASAMAMAAYFQHGKMAQVVPFCLDTMHVIKWQGYWRAGFIHVFKKFCKRVCTGIRLSAESNHLDWFKGQKEGPIRIFLDVILVLEK